MLGNDKYTVIGQNELSHASLNALVRCYEPLIQKDGLFLYECLLIHKQVERPFSDLTLVCNFNMDDLEAALSRLNRFGLVETYSRDNTYILLLKEPLPLPAFLKHDFYARFLRHEIGEQRFDALKLLVEDKEIPQDYRNVSDKLDLSLLSDWNKNMEASMSLTKKVSKKASYSARMNHFLAMCNNVSFPMEARTPDNLKEIESLLNIYGLTDEEMRSFVYRSVSKGDGQLDVRYLKNLCFSTVIRYKKEIVKGDYSVPCIPFLTALQNGKEVTPVDKKIIETLTDAYHLKSDVINVLLEHALNTCENRLYTSYLYPIAGDFHRNDIDSVEKAKEMLQKPRSRSSFDNYKDVLPKYDESQNQKASKEELDQFFANRGKQ